MTVDELLTASHAAHIVYRNAVRDGNSAAAIAALSIAFDNRAAAQSIDPARTDSAWADEARTYPHQALMEFYESKLNG